MSLEYCRDIKHGFNIYLFFIFLSNFLFSFIIICGLAGALNYDICLILIRAIGRRNCVLIFGTYMDSQRHGFSWGDTLDSASSRNST